MGQAAIKRAEASEAEVEGLRDELQASEVIGMGESTLGLPSAGQCSSFCRIALDHSETRSPNLFRRFIAAMKWILYA